MWQRVDVEPAQQRVVLAESPASMPLLHTLKVVRSTAVLLLYLCHGWLSCGSHSRSGFWRQEQPVNVFTKPRGPVASSPYDLSRSPPSSRAMQTGERVLAGMVSV